MTAASGILYLLVSAHPSRLGHPYNVLQQSSDGDIIEEFGDIVSILHRPSVVREYLGLLEDDDDHAQHDIHEENEEKVTRQSCAQGEGLICC